MKLNYRRTFLIGLAFMSICAFWQLYDYVVPYILQYTFQFPEGLSGIVMAMDNLVALILLPLFGSLSDRVKSPFGRRMPFIVCGTAAAAVLMLLLPVADWTRNLPMFIIVLALLLLAMSSYRSPAVALMPDITPKPLRSAANAVINLMGALGGIFTYAVIILLLPKIDTATGEKSQSYFTVFAVVAALMVASVTILALTVRERKLAALLPPDDESDGAPQNTGVHLAPEVRRSLIFILLSVALWYIAFNALSSAYSRYVLEVWGISEGKGASMMLVSTAVTTASYIPVGLLSSRIGRKKMILCGVSLMALSYLAGFFLTSYNPVIYAVMAALGIGWAAINVNSYPMVVEMSRGADVGRYTGIYYTFSMTAQIITPILSGFLIQHLGYRILFPYAVFFSVLAFLTMTQVRHGDARPEKKTSALEYLDADD